MAPLWRDSVFDRDLNLAVPRWRYVTIDDGESGFIAKFRDQYLFHL
jgi:hypothetical protein